MKDRDEFGVLISIGTQIYIFVEFESIFQVNFSTRILIKHLSVVIVTKAINFYDGFFY